MSRANGGMPDDLPADNVPGQAPGDILAFPPDLRVAGYLGLE